MLTDAECKNAICPPGKLRARLACSGGLYLEVSPAGSKHQFTATVGALAIQSGVRVINAKRAFE
jgi:hypothetical protein